MKRFLPTLFALIISIGLLSTCTQGQEKPVDKPGGGKEVPIVKTTAVQTAEISRTATLTGSVIATKVARIATAVEGPIVQAKIKEGDAVRKGEVVFRIGRSTSADASLASAREDLKKEKEELGRIEKLVKNGAIPGVELDKAQTNAARAEAQVAKAQETHNDYTLRSPMNGSVSKVAAAEGDYVAPRATLAEIYDPASLVVQCSVPEALTNSIHAGTKVIVTLDAYPGKTYAAKVSRVYSALDQKTRTLPVEVTLADKVRLVPGMFARLKAIMEKVPEAIIVPVETLIVTAKGTRALYVIQEGKAILREVETGIEEAGKIQIMNGIQPGDQVVVVGKERLKDGMAVKLAGSEKQDSSRDKKGEAKQ